MRKSLQQLYLYRDGIGGPRSNAQWRDQRQPDCIDTTNLAHDLGIAVTNPDDIIAGHTVDIDLEVREVSRESKRRKLVRASGAPQHPIVAAIAARLGLPVRATRQTVFIDPDRTRPTGRGLGRS